MNEKCVFCAIAEGSVPSFKIYEDDRVVSFLDINPFSRGHALVVPKLHMRDILSCDDETLSATVCRVKKIASHIAGKLGAKGFNILQNNGEAAGQTVKHLHFHIVPRYDGSTIAFESGAGDMEELARLADTLKFQD